MLRAHGTGGASATPFYFFLSPLAKKFFRAKPKRAGKKEGGLGEGIFARPLLLGGGWVCFAFGDAQVNQSFVQKRFALRPIIATRCNFYHFWGSLIARSPRLRLGSLRKFLYISGLNQRDGQNQKLQFYSAGGGSALLRNAQNENFVSNYFLSAFGGIRSQFFTFIAKGDLLKLRSKNL